MSRQTGGCAHCGRGVMTNRKKSPGMTLKVLRKIAISPKSREVVSLEIYHFNGVGAFKNQQYGSLNPILHLIVSNNMAE